MNRLPPVLIITVNFRRPDCTLAFLQSAAQLDDFECCHVVVVDNNSGDDSISHIQRAVKRFENVNLLASPENRGYFHAAKHAFDSFLEENCTPDWVIICNNDILFDRRSFLTELVSHDPNSIGVLAPAVISEITGLDSNPMIAKKPGMLRILRYRFLLSNYLIARLTQRMAPLVRQLRYRLRDFAESSEGRSRQIYAPHGAMLVFSRTFFQRGGSIDDGSFLFGEEIGVAETCLRIGLPIIYDSRLHVLHKDNQTTGRTLTAETYRHQKLGLQYAISKYLSAQHE